VRSSDVRDTLDGQFVAQLLAMLGQLEFGHSSGFCLDAGNYLMSRKLVMEISFRCEADLASHDGRQHYKKINSTFSTVIWHHLFK
jgi:hypothetical protein